MSQIKSLVPNQTNIFPYQFELHPTTEDEVTQVLKDLKSKTINAEKSFPFIKIKVKNRVFQTIGLYKFYLVSLVFESLVKRRLIDYLLKYKLINDGQHGFMPGRGIVSAVYEFIEFITNSLAEGILVSGIFLDLSKALDTVNHADVESTTPLGVIKKGHILSNLRCIDFRYCVFC